MMREADDAGCTPPGADDLRLERQLCFALYSAANLTTRLYRPLLEPLGITYPQYLALMALWERAPRSVGELGTALGLDSGTLTPLLKRLEAGGLVTRARDAADERRVLVDLTPAGRDLRARACAVPEALRCGLPMELEDAGALRDALWRYVQALRAGTLPDGDAPAP
ncbi:MarR family transcriptional regulator [Longimicrobium sp.]|uniref:MarR family winged helix-turn-helix transcriptional regulator n=1 Tax=Longimicrobium sp. TaxID=2029185 RepID=UPI002E2FFDF7|nr:MarR family transcriptional regulator [Longimicrobium sp.]HEX6038926.1 MarR family transcriptional regulator [Longimicrobium sp.]